MCLLSDTHFNLLSFIVKRREEEEEKKSDAEKRKKAREKDGSTSIRGSEKMALLSSVRCVFPLFPC